MFEINNMSGRGNRFVLTAAFAAVFSLTCFIASGKTEGEDSDGKPFVIVEYDSPRPKHEIRIGASTYPLFAAVHFTGGWSSDFDYPDWSDGTIQNALSDYGGDVYCSGTFSVEFCWILKKWFTMSAGIGYNHFWKTMYSGATGESTGTAHASAYYLLPQARFTYFSRLYVKLYSAAGLGMTIYDNNSRRGRFEVGQPDLSMNLMLQLVPIGITAGNRVFGFAELGIGSMFTGINAGIGFRF